MKDDLGATTDEVIESLREDLDEANENVARMASRAKERDGEFATIEADRDRWKQDRVDVGLAFDLHRIACARELADLRAVADAAAVAYACGRRAEAALNQLLGDVAEARAWINAGSGQAPPLISEDSFVVCDHVERIVRDGLGTPLDPVASGAESQSTETEEGA